MIKKLFLPSVGVGVPLLVIVIWIFGFNQAALSVLGAIKTIRGESVRTVSLASLERPVDNKLWTRMLDRYVNEEGLVDYQGWLSERDSLQIYLNSLSENPPTESATVDSQLAYWINAYNAFTIQLILDNYPLKSIKDVGGSIPMINSPWDIKFFKIGGEEFDLNTIEHKILRKRFDEPRIHFAINCASFSCPKLLNTSYEAEILNEQLDAQTIDFINDPERNLLARDQVQLSKLFDWFRGDFERSGNVVHFITKYSKQEIDPKARVSFLDYDWRLNRIN